VPVAVPGRPVGPLPPRRSLPRLSRIARALRASLQGRYRVTARNAVVTLRRGTATVRVEDRCNASAVRVIAGRVSVEDVGRDRTVPVRAGRTYIAPLPAPRRAARRAVLRQAGPPPNDDYLLSLSPEDPRTGSLPHNVSFTDTVDTTAATDQRDDLFAPERSGGGPEPTVCGGTVVGKTVWYDLNPDVDGFAEIDASGFDAVIAVYQYSRTTGRLLRGQCFNDSARVTEEALPPLRAGVAYTVQIGGVETAAGIASGRLAVRIRFLADRDGDGRIDRLDECPTLAGARATSFCPPTVGVQTSYTFGGAARGRLSLTRFDVRVARPRRVRIVLACVRGCAFTLSRTSRRPGVVPLVRGGARSLAPGARLELRVTARGHIGVAWRYRVRGGRLERVAARCLRPGSARRRIPCR
jgi:hypothetical protein